MREPTRSNGGIHILLRDGILLQQALITFGCDLRKLQVCLVGVQLFTRLLQLLIQLRRLDNSQELTLLHARADVGIPGFQVAACPCPDGSVDKGLHVAGQQDFLASAYDVWMNNGHSRNGGSLRIGIESSVRLNTGVQPVHDCVANNEREYQQDNDQSAQ